MSLFTLQTNNRAELADLLKQDKWIVACLCAAWCDVCSAYIDSFKEMAARHPDKHFLWIDIEDHADLVGDFEIENFPTLLIERDDSITFYGAMLPNIQIAERVLQSQAAQRHTEPVNAADMTPGRDSVLPGPSLRQRITDMP